MKHPHDWSKDHKLTSLHKKVLALFIIVVGDAVITVYLIVTQGWGEANPILDWCMENSNVSVMAITKIVISFLLLFLICKKEEAERHLNWAIPFYVIFLAVGMGFQVVLHLMGI
jgi:hypothetical protein